MFVVSFALRLFVIEYYLGTATAGMPAIRDANDCVATLLMMAGVERKPSKMPAGGEGPS